MNFPLYRKYPNNLSYFRIESEENFVELKITGSRYSLTEFKAKIHPDWVFISDMIGLHNGHWVESTMEEFEAVLDECKEKRKLLFQ